MRHAGGALAAGDLFLFASVAVAAIGYAFSGRLTSQMPGWEVISWVLVIALPISIPAAALTMPADVTHIALQPWLGLLYVALFSQWIGFFAWNAGMAIGGIALSGASRFLNSRCSNHRLNTACSVVVKFEMYQAYSMRNPGRADSQRTGKA